MRGKCRLLAILLVSVAGAREARAQDPESRISAIATALEEMRHGLPGKANLFIPPPPHEPRDVSRTEAVEAAKRLQYTVSEDARGVAGHPADIHFMLEGATIGADRARILVVRLLKQPGGTYTGATGTFAVDLTRVDGRWKVSRSYLFSVR
jgi:hypothetical protein